MIELEIEMESSGDWKEDTKVEHFVQFQDSMDTQVMLGGYCTDTYRIKKQQRLLKGNGPGKRTCDEACERYEAKLREAEKWRETCRGTTFSNADNAHIPNWQASTCYNDVEDIFNSWIPS